MSFTKRFFAGITLIVMLLTMIPFSASAAPSYWGFDNYDTIVQPGAPEEITSYPTTVKKVSASTYTMSSTISGVGTISISLIEEAWGTFNLGNWILTDTSGKSHNFTGASTDMEYVHQYYYSDSHVTWSGGNHGGEVLESLKLYDGVKGTEISLSVGQSYTANVIHVIEKTKLLHFPDQNPSDSINDYNNKSIAYTEDQVYAKLTRKYTFTGPQIKLNVDYLYMKDSYHARNYTCMLPIAKTYGLYCDMIDKDGVKIKTITTSEVGKADYSGPMNSGNAATRAVVYSKTNPKYQFDMRINTFKDSVNEFKDATFKTAFWDMNTSHNKLYFTRFDASKKILHAKDSEVHTECIWLFRYSADGSLPTYAEPGAGGETPISRNKTYNNTVSNAVQGDGVSTKYGAKLTDGVASDGFAYNDDSWYLLFNGHNAQDGIGTIIIDLGEVCDLTKFRAHLANYSGAGVTAPKSVKVYGSSDDATYTEMASFTLNTSADAIYWAEANAPADAKGRYIKFVFEIDGTFAYLNELEVYGTAASSGGNTGDNTGGTTDGPKDNLASDRNYNISGTNDPVVDATYGTDYSAKLTDGVADTAFDGSNGTWFMLGKNAGNAVGGVGTVTIDFDNICTIDKVRLHLINNASWLVYAPSDISVYVSKNGTDYTKVGSMPTNADATEGYWSELSFSHINGGSVRFEFTLNGDYALLNEIEVHGTASDEKYPVEDGSGDNTGDDNTGDDNTGNDNTGGDNTGDDNTGNDNTGDNNSGGDNTGNEDNTGGDENTDGDNNGDKPIVPNPDKPEPDEYMLGDVNDNGEIDSLDYILLKRAYFGTYALDEDAVKRADVNPNGEIDSMDYILLKRAYFGTYVIK